MKDPMVRLAVLVCVARAGVTLVINHIISAVLPAAKDAVRWAGPSMREDAVSFFAIVFTYVGTGLVFCMVVLLVYRVFSARWPWEVKESEER